jgi:DNA-binding response OmpR family regulator
VSRALPVILLVEDEFIILAAVADALERRGFEVAPCRSGCAAVALLESRERPDFAALVTDIHLGDGPSGWQVARRAREVAPDLPVLYMTAAGQAEWAEHGVDGGILVAKPFTVEDLADRAAELVQCGGVSLGEGPASAPPA